MTISNAEAVARYRLRHPDRVRAQWIKQNAKRRPRSAAWYSWTSMKQRCLNPRATGYERYGGKGITIHEPWLVFVNFLADMGERPEGTTLDRIDNDGNYEPGNVRWATLSDQARNRRQRQRDEAGRFVH